MHDRFAKFVSHVTHLTEEFERTGFSGMPVDSHHRMGVLERLCHTKQYRELADQVEIFLDELEEIEMRYLDRQQHREHQEVFQELAFLLVDIRPVPPEVVE